MAEKKFLVDLNLSGNKAKNFRLEDYADNTAPTSNFVGRMIYTTNSTNPDRVEVYNGSAWKTFAFTDDVPAVSITLTAPDLFTVTGSPAAYNGTLDFEWNTVAVNRVLAGPSTGSTAAIPTFRSLVAADIPSLSSIYQPLDADLTSIAGLAGTSGFLTKTAADTFALDTNTYLTTSSASSTYAPINNPIFTGTVTLPTSIVFEGATANDHETTLTLVDPTADRTVTIPDASGTVALFDGSGNLTVPGNLTVSGDTTTLNTATLLVEDNLIVLNSNITGIPTTDAGIEVERGDYTNATLYWNETANSWYVGTPGDTAGAATATALSLSGHTHATSDITGIQEYVEDTVGAILSDSGTIDFTYTDNSTSQGSITAAVILAASNPYLNTTSGLAVDLSTLEPKLVTDGFAKKYTTTIGDGTAQTFAVTHSLSTRAVTVSVFESASPWAEVEAEVLHTSTSVVTINTNSVPTAGQYTVVVVG
jgi:hypothetical protein